MNATTPSANYTLSLHDALPISVAQSGEGIATVAETLDRHAVYLRESGELARRRRRRLAERVRGRSEEHTSELQSPCKLVCRLLLEKKKKKKHNWIGTDDSERGT